LARRALVMTLGCYGALKIVGVIIIIIIIIIRTLYYTIYYKMKYSIPSKYLEKY